MTGMAGTIEKKDPVFFVPAALLVLLFGWMFLINGRLSAIESTTLKQADIAKVTNDISAIRAIMAGMDQRIAHEESRDIPSREVLNRLTSIDTRLDRLSSRFDKIHEMLIRRRQEIKEVY